MSSFAADCVAASTQAPLQPKADFECVDSGVSQQQAKGQSKLSRHQKMSICSMIACAFVGAGMIGFFILGPLVKHAMVASDTAKTSHFLGSRKFMLPHARPLSGLARAKVTSPSDIKMINLFGNSDESKQRRNDLSLRDAPAGSRVLSFRKQNAATPGLQLGLQFREGFGKSIFISKIIQGTQAAKYADQGKIAVGDEIVMVSATFGDEMWSARGVGKTRLEKSLSVRQGGFVKLCFETPAANRGARNAQLAAKMKKEKAMQSRLQKQLTEETESAKDNSGNPFGGLFR